MRYLVGLNERACAHVSMSRLAENLNTIEVTAHP